MNRSGIVTLSAGFFVATVGVCWLIAGGQRAQQAIPQSRAGVDPEALSAVLGQVESLRAQVENLKAQHASLILPTASSTASPTAEPALIASAGAAAPPPLEYAAVAASYETLFDAERTDSAWSVHEQRAIFDLFARGVEGATLQKAECHEDMCRVNILFSNTAARQKFISGGIGQPPFDHGGFFHTDETTGAFTLFSAREGRALPAVP
jgi:hypothetical protein